VVNGVVVDRKARSVVAQAFCRKAPSDERVECFLKLESIGGFRTGSLEDTEAFAFKLAFTSPQTIPMFYVTMAAYFHLGKFFSFLQSISSLFKEQIKGGISS